MALKYPIVLVHGIAMRDKGKVFPPWGRIPAVLIKNGVDLYFGKTDAWGSIESNAEMLKQTIDTILDLTKKDKINIIAHSKGGIDSRYFIMKYNYGNKVASLTTISTPHHGSEIADLLYGKKRFHSIIIRIRLLLFGKLFGDANPDIYKVSYQLTTQNMKIFNQDITMDDKVYYQSIYTTMNDPSNDPALSISYNYIKRISGENDGLVSGNSAKWGKNIIKIDAAISHEQIIDHNLIIVPAINIPDIYLKIADGLCKMGF